MNRPPESRSTGRSHRCGGTVKGGGLRFRGAALLRRDKLLPAFDDAVADRRRQVDVEALGEAASEHV